jgi:alpha-ribazole phosphatase
MVFTSPLLRCLQTADILYPDTYTEEFHDLTDLNLGEFQGKTVEELRGTGAFEAWMQNSLLNPPPGGEKAGDFTARIVDGIGAIFSRMMEERMQSAAVVTHAGVIMTLLTAIGQPRLPLHEWKVNNGCGYTLLLTPQMWMRDRSCEVFCHQPQPVPEESGRDETDFYG